jgi:hypothetical protein
MDSVAGSGIFEIPRADGKLAEVIPLLKPTEGPPETSRTPVPGIREIPDCAMDFDSSTRRGGDEQRSTPSPSEHGVSDGSRTMRRRVMMNVTLRAVLPAAAIVVGSLLAIDAGQAKPQAAAATTTATPTAETRPRSFSPTR